jgi:hypothetical protein
MSDEEEDPEFIPPTVERVRRRAWATSAVVCRGFLEVFPEPSEAAVLHSRILSWIDAISLRPELEPWESEMIEADVGTLDERTSIDGTWRSEGLAVLAWALSTFELPPHDTLVDASAAADSVLFLAPDALQRSRELRLRSEEELDDFAAVQLALHWRLREFSLRPAAMDYPGFVERASFGPLSIEGVVLAENDLAIDGVPISEAPTDRVRECQSIAAERHRAINWLLGWHEVYSEVDTST